MADETIKLRVDTGDPEFDKRLVRRLTEEYEGIAAFIGKETFGEKVSYDMVIDEEYEGSILPVSRLVSDLSQIYLKRTGKTLIRPKKVRKPFTGSALHSEVQGYRRWPLFFRDFLP